MVAIHLPTTSLIAVFISYSHHAWALEGADLKLQSVVRKPNPLKLSVAEVAVYDGPVGVDNHAKSMQFVELEVSYISDKVLSLQDAEAITLIRCIREALVNSVNEMHANHFGLLS